MMRKNLMPRKGLKRLNRPDSIRANPKVLRVPFLIQANQPAIPQLVAEGKKAQSMYADLLKAIPEVALSVDPVATLSYFGFYFASPATWPMVTTSGASGPGLLEHHVALYQALTLTKQLESYGDVWPLSRGAQKVATAVYALSDAARTRHLADLETQDPTSFYLAELQESVRNDRQRNRTPLLADATRHLVEATLTSVADQLEHEWGLSPRGLLQLIDSIGRVIGSRLRAHVDFGLELRGAGSGNQCALKLRSLPVIWPPEAVDDLDRLASHNGRLRDAYDTVGALWDWTLQRAFTFTVDDLEQATPGLPNRRASIDVLDQLALTFGALDNVPVEHFFLANPTYSQPLIKLAAETYFCPILPTLGKNLELIVEALIDARPTLRRSLDRAKGPTLENEAVKLFEQRFTNATIHTRSLWALSPNQEGENDITIDIDSIRLIIEAKSGRVPERALRGDPAQLRSVLSDLVIAPARQAANFETVLATAPSQTLKKIDGEQNRFESAGIIQTCRLSILLEEIGLVAGSRARLLRAGLLNEGDPFQPTMSLAELYLILDLLPSELDRLHYIVRRSEMEARLVWSGDELDAFTFYVETNLEFPDDDVPALSYTRSQTSSRCTCGKRRCT